MAKKTRLPLIVLALGMFALSLGASVAFGSDRDGVGSYKFTVYGQDPETGYPIEKNTSLSGASREGVSADRQINRVPGMQMISIEQIAIATALWIHLWRYGIR
jgi:hypothetical protein